MATHTPTTARKVDIQREKGSGVPVKCLIARRKAQAPGHILLIKFLGQSRHKGGSAVPPSTKKWKKSPWPAYLTRGGMGPIPGFAFLGRKSFRLAAAPVRGPRRAVAAWWTSGAGHGDYVLRESNLSLEADDADGAPAVWAR